MSQHQSIALETLHIDLTSALVAEIRQLAKPWHATPESEQKEVIARLHAQVLCSVTTAVEIIAAAGCKRIQAKLDQITAKGSLKCALTLSARDPSRHDLLDSVGQVVIVCVPPAELVSPSQAPPPDPDQLSLPIQGVAA